MREQQFYLGLDIGGTKVRAGLVAVAGREQRGRLIKTAEEPTVRKGSKQALEQCCRLIHGLLSPRSLKLKALGIAAPGPIDEKKGFLIKAPNLPGWDNLPLGPALHRQFGVPVTLANDANAAALAEACWGAGQDKSIVFFATISTGIGAGLVINRKLYTGHTGLALEGGHLTIDWQGERCGCGNQGCIEAYASGSSIARRASQLGTGAGPDAATLLKMATKGDSQAKHLIQETYQYLGVWLGNIVNLLDPAIIVLGGGVSNWGAPLFKALKNLMPQYSINPHASKIPIVPAKLGKDMGVFGAAAACLNGHE